MHIFLVLRSSYPSISTAKPLQSSNYHRMRKERVGSASKNVIWRLRWGWPGQDLRKWINNETCQATQSIRDLAQATWKSDQACVEYHHWTSETKHPSALASFMKGFSSRKQPFCPPLAWKMPPSSVPIATLYKSMSFLAMLCSTGQR